MRVALTTRYALEHDEKSDRKHADYRHFAGTQGSAPIDVVQPSTSQQSAAAAVSSAVPASLPPAVSQPSRKRPAANEQLAVAASMPRPPQTSGKRPAVPQAAASSSTAVLPYVAPPPTHSRERRAPGWVGWALERLGDDEIPFEQRCSNYVQGCRALSCNGRHADLCSHILLTSPRGGVTRKSRV